MKRIAILGGSYDPPHAGHLHAARLALSKMDFDELWVMVALNPLKPSSTSASDRLVMAKLAFKGLKKVKVSDFEIKNKIRYTCDTLAALPRTNYYTLIIGSDLVPQFPKWKNYRQLGAMQEFVIIIRPGHALRKTDLRYFKHFTLLRGKLDVSSTQIREALRKGKPINSVPKPVLAYIRKKKLYASK